MQLVAVEDIGRFVAAVFADPQRFGGQPLKLASDTVTGRELGVILSEAAGRPITYARFSDEALAAKPDLAHIAASLEAGPLADHVDLHTLRAINPEMVSLRSWLAGSGHRSFEEALEAGIDHA